ncbi:hypothetical protein DZD18_14070 [Rhodobacteraceae bacterium W635]|uniref:Hint domain-containing protein n=1 Tax=Nioella halotolerans TaxID=2303578 RepID=UPI000E3DDA16|nr:hypothetical protein DZD18_14070 [Rhodobacteraceae bacterium W635]
MTDPFATAPQAGVHVLHGLGAALPPGTEILTLAGALPAEALYPGERVITRDAGAQPLLEITRHTVAADMRFIHVSRDALGGKPTRDLLLPATQPVLLRDWRAQAMFGTPSARVALSRLVDGEHLRWSDARPAALLSLRFRREHVIYADGLEVMSAHA